MATVSLQVVGINHLYDQITVVEGDVDCTTYLGTRFSGQVADKSVLSNPAHPSTRDGEGSSSSAASQSSSSSCSSSSSSPAWSSRTQSAQANSTARHSANGAPGC